MNPAGPTIACSVRANLPGKAYGVRQPAILVQLRTVGSVSGARELALEEQISPKLAKSGAPAAATAAVALSVMYWSVALQQAAGLAVFEGGALLQSRRAEGDACLSVVSIPHPPGCVRAAVRALEWVVRWLGSPASAGLDALAESVEALLQSLRPFAPAGKNTIHFLRAAHAAGIPWDRVTADYYQYGWGACSRLMQSSFTDRSPVLGAALARNKHLAADVLRRAGLPVPPHALAKTADEAVRVAAKLGYPVVVKPADTDGGVGVAAGLRNEAAVRRAFDAAARHSKLILVEKHFHGQDYRLLVFHGELIWTVVRQPGGVTGNGIDSVGQLLERLNRDPRRGTGVGAALKTLVLDAEAIELLGEQQYTVASVPPPGAFVRLRRIANVAVGGIAIPANDNVHPDNRRLAEQATLAFGLDLAGIDLLIPDIAQSWYQTGAAICEINGQPQFGVNNQQHVHGDILKALVPRGGRIPVAVVLGHDNRELLQALQPRLAGKGWRVGLATAQGAFVDGVQQGRSADLFGAAQALLFNNAVDVLVIEVTDSALLKTGLPLDAYDVLLLASGFAAGTGHALAQVFAMLASHHRRAVLVNASDPACVDASRPERQARLIGGAPATGAKRPGSVPALLAESVMGALDAPAPQNF